MKALTASGNASAEGKTGSKKGGDDFERKVTAESNALCTSARIAPLVRWQRVDPIGPGLQNLGNTCFMNAVLQCIAYTPALAQYVARNFEPRMDAVDGGALRNHHRGNKWLGSRRKKGKKWKKRNAATNGGGGAIDARMILANHVRRTSVRKKASRNANSIAPRSFALRLRMFARSFRFGRQEDSHEFLRALLDAVQRAALKARGLPGNATGFRSETTFVHRVFGGYLRSQVRCMKCGYRSNKYDAFLDLSLELRGGTHSLDAALRAFTEAEILDDDNKWQCDGCKRRVRARKQLTVRRPPAVLVLHLKRFAFGRYGSKLTQHVSFPEHLDVGPYLSDSKSTERSTSASGSQHRRKAKRERWKRKQTRKIMKKWAKEHPGEVMMYSSFVMIMVVSPEYETRFS